MKQILCPACGYAADRTVSIDTSARPKPGDASLCMSCGEASIWQDGMLLRLPTEKEASELSWDSRIWIAQKYIRARGPIPWKGKST